jgi:prevent-host-death family protein
VYTLRLVSKPLPISEVRRRLSALVERVARGAKPIAISRYGNELAVLVGAERYARLARGKGASTPRARSLEGTLSLTCPPGELIKERGRLSELWLAGVAARTSPDQRRRP